MKIAFLIAPILLVALLTGCDLEPCRADTTLIELRIELSGVSPSEITHLELTSVVTASPAVGSAHPYHERRVGTLPWPENSEGGGLDLVMDPGRYIRRLQLRPQDQREFHYELTVRAFGGRRLVAQGRYAKDLSADRCYLEQRLTLSAQGVCEGRRAGDACVGAGDEVSVCVCDSTAQDCGGGGLESLVCEASVCGDGYTDRASGELCEPGLGPVACSGSCLPAPVDVVVTDALDASYLAPCPMLSNNVGGDTLTRGLHELAYPISATTLRPAMSLLIADIDGDGADEMVVGFPEGYDPGSTIRRGKVVVRDWPVMGNIMLGDPGRAHATLVGGPSVRPHWLGASLAAGDFNGDGARDLVVGAPLREEGAGAAFVLFGGSGATLAPSLPVPFELTFDTPQDQGQYMALEGTPASAAGNTPDLLGYQVRAADLDGDGLDDLIVAAPGYTRDASSAGAVFVVPGGQPLWDNQTLAMASLPVLTIRTHRPAAKLGAALAVGDVDGDGLQDLVVGSEASGAPPDSLGGVYVLYGHAGLLSDLPRSVWVSGPEAAPDHELSALAPPDVTSPLLGVGGALAVCDLDRDGAGEVVATIGRVGSVVSPSGVLLVQGQAMARIRQGGAPLDLVTDAVHLTGTGDDDLGAALHCGDANGDSTPDLLMGAPGHDRVLASSVVVPDVGALYVVLGSVRAGYWDLPEVALPVVFDDPHAPFIIPLLRLTGAQPHGRLGGAVAVSGHLGLSDLTHTSAFTYVAAPGWSDAPEDVDHKHKGRVWGLYLPALLPCGHHASCPEPTP